MFIKFKYLSFLALIKNYSTVLECSYVNITSFELIWDGAYKKIINKFQYIKLKIINYINVYGLL